MSRGQEPVIIIKKKGGHAHGHHGGAWKVAYADFVTAMMAFFLVMWLVGQKQETKAGIASYFRNPGAFDGGQGLLPGVPSSAPTDAKAPSAGVGVASAEAATEALERAAEDVRRALEGLPNFDELSRRIDVVVTEEGLRIELRESPDDGFFASGSAGMKAETVELLHVIAAELGKLSNRVAVEGHTDSAPYSVQGGQYTNWELSADRANAARRVLVGSGMQPSQVEAVRGYADTRLRTPDTPLDPSNRRISIIVRRT
jgi:chemotaxis protein MotB